MKGIVFNLLAELVQQQYGEDIWDDLLEKAQIEGSFTSLGSYPYEDLRRLVSAASSKLGMPKDEVLRWFGRNAIPLLAARYPKFFEPHASTRPFLLTLNEIIHPEVRKIYPGAHVPEFDYDTSVEGLLIMEIQFSAKALRLR
jgi:hypothetical protein